MKRTLAKIIGITMIIILSMQNSFVFALKETEKLEQEQTLNNSKIKEYEKKQKELEKQKSAAMKEVEKLISEISDSEDEIEELEGQINNIVSSAMAKVDFRGVSEEKREEIQTNLREYTNKQVVNNYMTNNYGTSTTNVSFNADKIRSDLEKIVNRNS